MTIDTFTVGPFSENTYLISEEKDAILIDPGFATDREFAILKEKLKSSEVEIQAVLLTHAHIDHVLGLKTLLDLTNVPVYLNHSDLFLWKNVSSQAGMFGMDIEGFDFIPESLPSGREFRTGRFNPFILYTPGHSPDHVSLYFRDQNVVISGDALFRESIGRTDLYRGDQHQLTSSIRSQLYTLPGETRVYPGHGPVTTIAHEKAHNPFVKDIH